MQLNKNIGCRKTTKINHVVKLQQDSQEIIQYILICNKCKDSITYFEKCEAIANKLFHERFMRHRVTMRVDVFTEIGVEVAE